LAAGLPEEVPGTTIDIELFFARPDPDAKMNTISWR
jgi:hypothetical protein